MAKNRYIPCLFEVAGRVFRSQTVIFAPFSLPLSLSFPEGCSRNAALVGHWLRRRERGSTPIIDVVTGGRENQVFAGPMKRIDMVEKPYRESPSVGLEEKSLCSR